jgi:hypothetical protein
MSFCSICCDKKIDDNNDNICRICNNKTCNSCFTNILMMDKDFTFCILKQLPLIYECCYCKSSNRLKHFDNNIQNHSIEILEKKLNIIKISK